MKNAVFVSLGKSDQRWYEYRQDDSTNDLTELGSVYRKANYPEQRGKNASVSYVFNENNQAVFAYKSSDMVNNYNGYSIATAYSKEELQNTYAVDYIGSYFNLDGSMSKGEIIDAVSQGWLNKTNTDIDAVFEANKLVVTCIVDKLIELLDIINDRPDGKRFSVGIHGGDLKTMQSVLVCALRCLPVSMANSLTFSSNANKNANVDIFCSSDSVEPSEGVVYFDISDQEKYKNHHFYEHYALYLRMILSPLSEFLSTPGVLESESSFDEIRAITAHFVLNDILTEIGADKIASSSDRISGLIEPYTDCQDLADKDEYIVKMFTNIAYSVFFTKNYLDIGETEKKFIKYWLKPNAVIKEYIPDKVFPDVSQAISEILGDKNFNFEYLKFLFSCVCEQSKDYTEVHPEIKKEIEDFLKQQEVTDRIVKNISDGNVQDIINNYIGFVGKNKFIAQKFTDVAYTVFFSEAFFVVNEDIRKALKNCLKPNDIIKGYIPDKVFPDVLQAISEILKAKNFNFEYFKFLFSCVCEQSKDYTEVYPEIKKEIEDLLNRQEVTDRIVKNISDSSVQDIINNYIGFVGKNKFIAQKFTDIAYTVFFSEAFFVVNEDIRKALKNCLKPNDIIKGYKLDKVFPVSSNVDVSHVAQAISKVFGSDKINSNYTYFLFSCVYGDLAEFTEVYPEIKDEIESFLNKQIFAVKFKKGLPDSEVQNIVHNIMDKIQKKILNNDPEKTVNFICSNIESFGDVVKSCYATILYGQNNGWLNTFLSIYVKRATKSVNLDKFIYQIFGKMQTPRRREFLKIEKDEQVTKWLKDKGFIDKDVNSMIGEEKSVDAQSYIKSVLSNVPIKNRKKWLKLCRNRVNDRAETIKANAFKLSIFVLCFAIALLLNHFALKYVIYNILGSDVSMNLIWIIDVFCAVLHIIWGLNIYVSSKKIGVKFVIKMLIMTFIVVAFMVVLTFVVIKFVP